MNKHERNRASGGRLEKVSGSLLVRRFTVRQPEMYRVIKTVSSEKLTSLSQAALCELAQTAMDIEFSGLEGDFLQVGCELGAVIVIAHAKRRARTFVVYDSFSARAELSAHGADERLNVQIVPGPYEEMPVSDEALALVNLSCGEYDSMHLLLERLAPRLVPGGHLIINDYLTHEECKRAVDDYFRGKKGFQLVRKSRLHVIKN